METFKNFLAEELKDREFTQAFLEERHRLRIAYEIRKARKRRNLTQRQLAQLAGTTQ
ncbi:MAG: transcriptional regulator, partial [Deltaproteobacteria bacterium]